MRCLSILLFGFSLILAGCQHAPVEKHQPIAQPLLETQRDQVAASFASIKQQRPVVAGLGQWWCAWLCTYWCN